MHPDDIRVISNLPGLDDNSLVAFYTSAIDRGDKSDPRYVRQLELCMVNRFMAKSLADFDREDAKRSLERSLICAHREIARQSEFIRSTAQNTN